jgi:signal peptidase II
MNSLSRRCQIAWLLLLLVTTAGCDQATKHVARRNLNAFDGIMLMGGWGELRLAENPGAFLSLGATMPPALRKLVFTGAAGVGLLALAAYLLSRPRISALGFTGLTLILAGGASNLIDRVTRQGFVTDFITLRLGPIQTGVFNVADMVVMTGMTLLIWAAWKTHKTPPEEKPHSE